jgi:RING-box protein 1
MTTYVDSTTLAPVDPTVNSTEPAPVLKCQVNKLNPVALWTWDIQNDTCAICKNSMQDLCVDCTANGLNNGCCPVWGKCNHAFHNHCISLWLKTKHICPLCNGEWVVAKIESYCTNEKYKSDV